MRCLKSDFMAGLVPSPPTLQADYLSPAVAYLTGQTPLSQWVNYPFRHMPMWPKVTTVDGLSQLHAHFDGKSINEDKSKELEMQGGESRPDQHHCLRRPYSWTSKEAPLIRAAFPSTLASSNTRAIHNLCLPGVRKYYLRLYNRCDSRYNKISAVRTLLPASVVITGQPGIGKCFSP